MKPLEYNEPDEKGRETSNRRADGLHGVFQTGVENEKSYHLAIMSKDIIGMNCCSYRDTWH